MVATMEIEQRISRLLSHIAKTNKLEEASGKGVGDFVTVDGNLHRIVMVSGSSRVNENSYFLIDFDSEELSDICVELARTNPKIVAPLDVNGYLIELIQRMKKNGWSKRGINPEINRVIEHVKKHKGDEAEVTVPIWGLDLGDSLLIVGDVEFRPRPFPEDVEEEVRHVDPDGIGVKAIAVTSSTGDQATIFSNAEIKINQAINIIRAFSFPLVNNFILQEICFDGDYRMLRSFGLLSNYTTMRKTGIYTSATLDVRMSGVIPLDIKRELAIMNLTGFSELLKVINYTDKFSKRIVKSVDWLGEATKPDVLPAKFIKTVFSIDSLIGADEKNIPDSGKRMRISERAAFLLGKNYKARKLVFDKINNIVQKRDEIAHGGSSAFITAVDVGEAGKYARALLQVLLLGEPKFKSTKQLAEWVRKQTLLG